jgi:hypothetical protein
MNRHTGNDAFGQAADWVVRTAKANPEALLVLAAGGALLLRGAGKAYAATSASARQGYRSSDFDARNNPGNWPEGMSRAAGKASAYASDAASRVSDAASRATGYAAEAGNRVADYASDATSRIADTASRATDYASDAGNRIADTASGYASSMSKYAGDVQRNVAEGASAVSDYASEIGRNISEQVHAVSDYAGDMGRSIADQASRWTGGTRGTVQSGYSTVQSGYSYVLREQPLAVVVMGLAAGAALAAMFPATEVEAKALRPAGDALADTAARVKENLMGAAGEAGERIKQRVAEHGLNTEGLQELAKDVAKEAVGAFSGKPAVAGTDNAANAAHPVGGRP